MNALFSKEYVESHFVPYRAFAADQKDVCANDYGPPDRLYASESVPWTKEEEAAYYSSLTEDSIF